MRFQVFHIPLSASRIGISAVTESVDEYLFDPVFTGHITQLIEVPVQRMYAPVGKQSHEVYLFPLITCIGEGPDQGFVFRDRVVADGTVDLYQVLVNHPSCTDVEVTHLRIPHLPVRKTHVLARSEQPRGGVFLLEPVHVGSWNLADHIGCVTFSDPPAVEDHQQSFSGTHIVAN